MAAAMPKATDNRTVKARHRAMWAMGDYPAVAAATIPALGTRLVEVAGVRVGQRVLDVAAGAGNVAIPAAVIGAEVVACDLTPQLLAAGREAAERQGVVVDWQEADAEALPFADEEFDVVLSCVGVMFAPRHQASAREMLRVCRPGATIGLLNWTPEGFIGQLLAAMKPYAPPPPPGSQPPTLWGREEHVRSLFGDRLTDIAVRREAVKVDCFARAEDFRDFFRDRYGPVMAVYRAVADDPDRMAALDHDVLELARRHDRGTTNLTMNWEYVIVTARVSQASQQAGGPAPPRS